MGFDLLDELSIPLAITCVIQRYIGIFLLRLLRLRIAYTRRLALLMYRACERLILILLFLLPLQLCTLLEDLFYHCSYSLLVILGLLPR